MLNLAEYRQRPALLADWLPWAGLVAPGVVLNKDGSFQRTFQFRGPDLDSATQGELIATSARQNNALRRTGSGWAFYIEAERMRASSYPQSSFPEPLSWLVDEGDARRSRSRMAISRASITSRCNTYRRKSLAPVRLGCCTRTGPLRVWTGVVGLIPSWQRPIACSTCSMV